MDIKHLKPALLIIGMLLFSSGMADEGEQLFKTNCAACHSIGKGRLVGPDLNNISSKRSQEWLISFIKSPTALINSGDADAIAVFEEYNKLLMPDYSYSDAQIKGILAYIDQSGTASNEASASPAVDILDGTTSENIDKGLLLFSGNQGFSNGGAACNSCHNVRDDRIFSSGTLAKDLSETFEVMGSAGIAAIIKNPPFPVMTITYKNNAITEEEAVNLTAYLKSVSEDKTYQQPSHMSIKFVFFGIVVFILVLLSTMIIYVKGKKHPVNREILNRPSQVIN